MSRQIYHQIRMHLFINCTLLNFPSLSYFCVSEPPPPSSVYIHLTWQVATTATPESVTRSAMTERKNDSTTGTFPELLLIRGAGHAL